MLILSLGIVGALALIIELILLLGRDVLSGQTQVAALRESIRKTQSEQRAAEKKLDALRTTRRGAVKELETAYLKIEELEQQARRAPEKPPVLIYTVGVPGAFGPRYRARITKKLPHEADENQTRLWKHESYVEIVSANAETARQEALRQFPEANGYTIAPFVAMREATESAA